MGLVSSAWLLLSLLTVASLARPCTALESLTIARVDRKIDLQTGIVRTSTTIKFENEGSEPITRFVFAIPAAAKAKLAFLAASAIEGKSKSRSFTMLKTESTTLSPADLPPSGAPAGADDAAFYSVQLLKPVGQGDAVLLEIYSVLFNYIAPFPAEISQSQSQLMLFKDSHLLLTPYPVRTQITTVKLPSSQVESYTQRSPSRKVDTELRFGPYEDAAPFSISPLTVHFECNRPLAVVRRLQKEVQISHWGNVYVTENYEIVNAGAKHKGVFSRLDYQSRPMASGLAAVRGLLATLPARSRSVYYRDEIGNISTSHMRQSKKKTELEVEPRYPLLGGWSVTFQIGFSVPLSDLVSVGPDGVRVLNISLGSSFGDLPVEELTVKIALPEGSKIVEAVTKFPLEESRETTFSYLDLFGRPTVVLKKGLLVAEEGVESILVLYSFSTPYLLFEPLLLVAAFLLFFLLFILYIHSDLTISKTSPSYLARLQQEQVLDALHRLQVVVSKRQNAADQLDGSLQKLGRSGNVASARAVRRAVEAELKESSKELKEIQDALEVNPSVLRQVSILIVKEKEKLDKALQKHLVSVEAYEKSSPAKEIDAKVKPIQEKFLALKAEVKELLLELE